MLLSLLEDRISPSEILFIGKSHIHEIIILNEKHTSLSNNKVRLEALLKKDREDSNELQVTLKNMTAQLLNAQTNLSSEQINVQKL